MFPTAPSFRLFLLAFCLLIFDFCCAYPAPYSYHSTLFPRQETQLTLPATVTRTERITTGVGTFIQTCTITLTPTVVNGVDLVREEKACVLKPDNGNGDTPGAPPLASSSTVSTGSPLPPPTPTPSVTLTGTTDTLTSTSTDVPPSTTDLSSNSTVTGLPPASSLSSSLPVVSVTLTSIPRPSVNTSVPSPPSSTGTSTSSVVVPSSDVPVEVIGISSVPNPAVTPQPGSTGVPTGSSPDNTPPSLPQSSSSSPPSPSPTPTASSENVGAPAAPMEPPGKKLEVLPIGLGVFAGVSVIALLVVGIVTYERTKHRRNFRKHRLEEAGSRMGYGAA